MIVQAIKLSLNRRSSELMKFDNRGKISLQNEYFIIIIIIT